MHGTPVEVRKNPKATTWYSATMLDINGDNIRVGFEEETWPTREVPAYSVRRCPQEVPGEAFDPKVDEAVEVVTASESSPSGWALGRVKAIKNSFYFIGFVGSSRGPQDLIVERSALRRVNSEPSVDTSALVRRLIPVDNELHIWIRSQDSIGCLSHVQNKGRLLVSSCMNIVASPDSPDPPQVLLIGDEHAVDLGEKLLLQIHFKNQIEMQRFHEQREVLMERLTERQRWYSTQHKEVFTAEQSLVGKIIGKKGEHINKVREKHGVEIHLQDENSNDSTGSKIVTVTGQTAEAVKKARDELEYISVKIPVESDQIGWILGRGFQNISDIARKTELHYARFDDKTNSLELLGLRHQVEDAKLMISAHREYLPAYQDMDEEQKTIQGAFLQLGDRDKGGGKKGGRGKGARGEHGASANHRGAADGSWKGGGGGWKGGKDGKDGKDGSDGAAPPALDDMPSLAEARRQEGPIGKGGQRRGGRGGRKGDGK